MKRVIQPEWLDRLPARHPAAARSRRDLHRLNAWMGHGRIMSQALASTLNGAPPPLTELGAGDGRFLLRVASRLRARWPGAEALLLDRLDVFEPEISRHFEKLGWRVRTQVADALVWLASPQERSGTVLCNLLLHHFQPAPLLELLTLAAGSADTLIALEPRRSAWALYCSRLLRCIGCGPVTCHDAPVSVRAGFAGRELSALWPDPEGWDMAERRAGLFSHLFIARRKLA